MLVLVLWLRARILSYFHWSNNAVAEKFHHHTALELIWAIIPGVIIAMIALPSVTLIYTVDHQLTSPSLTVKVVGRQWYWSYQMKEHVLFSPLN